MVFYDLGVGLISELIYHIKRKSHSFFNIVLRLKILDPGGGMSYLEWHHLYGFIS